MKKTILITGATSGIGLATARYFAKEGHRLILCGRNESMLAQLSGELQVENTTLVFDVRNRESVDNEIGSLKGNFKNIDVLINNAGNAHGLDPIQTGSIEDWDAMIDINVKGLLYVSKAVVPGMVERQNGQIINIGSLAGKEAYPNGNVYCASKYAIDGLTAGMRMDLYKYNIRVSQICPGLVDTGFSTVRFKGDKARAAKAYEGMKPLVAEDIADIIGFMVSRPAHVNIADMVVMPVAQASTTLVNRV